MTQTIKFEVSAGQDAPMTLTKAILLYQGSGDQTFATVHDVATQGGAPVILDGKPMTAASAVRLARALSKRAAQGGFVPFNLLYMDGETIAWWVPPACRHIAFRAPELGAAERGEVVPHPGLVFAVGHGRQWRVWAVKGSERPTEQTALYQAPYFNVSGDGVICTGNVSLPNGTSAEKIEAWNTAFFGSFFTHPNANGKLLTYRGGAYKFWRDMLDGKHAEFPERVLVASGETLRQAIAPRSER